MSDLEILGHVTRLADKWEQRAEDFAGASRHQCALAAKDFRALQHAIEKDLDDMAEGILKQEKGEAPGL